MRSLTQHAAPLLLDNFSSRQQYLSMLMGIGTTAEEWFRIEILGVLLKLPGITIVGTNHRTQQGADRPDFTLTWNNHALLVELKVLPQDKNYPYGWQRFLASPNNRKDFNSVVGGTRSGVIYIHWADEEDWRACRLKIEAMFEVECLQEDVLSCASSSVVFSYWVAKINTASA